MRECGWEERLHKHALLQLSHRFASVSLSLSLSRSLFRSLRRLTYLANDEGLRDAACVVLVHDVPCVESFRCDSRGGGLLCLEEHGLAGGGVVRVVALGEVPEVGGQGGGGGGGGRC